MDNLIGPPIYRQIALDIAGKICHGELKEGERLFGRSILAGEYHVSPETIRRAMFLLEDMQVVVVNQGSGINIHSKQRAYDFIQRFQTRESVNSLRSQIKTLLSQKKKIEDELNQVLGQIIDYADRFKNIDSITPFEIEIPEKANIIGKNANDIKFWQNTGATIIAIRRNNRLILSPGPYIGFEKGDTIFVVGEANALERINHFIMAGKVPASLKSGAALPTILTR
jgi:K+/H+ antiporter YhaU regulatory subunit KhtT